MTRRNRGIADVIPGHRSHEPGSGERDPEPDTAMPPSWRASTSEHRPVGTESVDGRDKPTAVRFV
ncbi:hypothetical protein BOSEA31B_10469 [Hyphomicrobiales bacterium]|nr:hypothetical protein BOSEA31B_10469 [Hyphomicrobiales bacterium]CAH1700323.1 hypothetical protein BOSEA1005_20022 [Hyphomicrobiales bacterium]CAI0344204.1 hypothetical protein BO1005MUT1_320034 [Hyphomicrobiales bacterium]